MPTPPKRADMIVHEAEPYNAESPRGALQGRPITDVDAFYSRNHGPVPVIDPASWTLDVGGLVDRPARLVLADLERDFDRHEVTATLQCAGNRRAELLAVRDIPGEAPWGPGAISTATWVGARLGDVLEACGIQPAAAHVELTGPDISALAEPPQPFGASISTHKALAPETLLAWRMNGQPLPAAHGGPVRVVVPGWIGARSVKWVRRVTALATASDNWFQAVAYRLLPADPSGGDRGVALGAVAVNSDILSPADGATVASGPLTVQGYAFAGDDRGVARVDLSVDDGATWVQAELDHQPSPWAWRHWYARVDLPPGPAEIVARAWDTAASVQPESARHVWNPKGYVNNSWARARVTAT